MELSWDSLEIEEAIEDFLVPNSDRIDSILNEDLKLLSLSDEDEDDGDIEEMANEGKNWKFVENYPAYLRVQDGLIAEKTYIPPGNLVEHRPWDYLDLLEIFTNLESLLIGWKRRTDHKFTAHLEKSRFYHQCESETDEEGIPNEKSNALLTKIKYCESTNIFCNIFKKPEDFRSCLKDIRNFKKRVLDVGFALFLQSIPDHLIPRLPDEIWFKIWRFSQDPTPQKNFRFQFKDEKTKFLEKIRLVELFVAAFRLHRIVFQTLYSVVLKTKFSLDQDNESADRPVILDEFPCYMEELKRNFHRFHTLEILYHGKVPGNAPDLVTKVRRGIFSLHHGKIEHNLLPKDPLTVRVQGLWTPWPLTYVFNYDCRFFKNQILSETFVFLQAYKSQSGDLMVQFIVWNNNSQKPLAVISTEVMLTNYLGCFEYGCDVVSFVGNKLLFTVIEYLDGEIRILTYSWTLEVDKYYYEHDSNPLEKNFFAQTNHRNHIVSQGLMRINGESHTLLMYSFGYDASELYVYDDSKNFIFSESFEARTLLKAVKGDKVLLGRKKEELIYTVHLYDIAARRTLAEYSIKSLTSIHNLPTAIFDDHPESSEFLVFSRNNRFCKVVNYLDSSSPELVFDGLTPYQFEDYFCSYTFYKGLFFFSSTEDPISHLCIKCFDFKSRMYLIVTPFYCNESLTSFQKINFPFRTSHEIFFVDEDKLCVFSKGKIYLYLDYSVSTEQSIQCEYDCLSTAL